MNLGGVLRRSRRQARATRLLSSTALLCVVAGSLGAGVAAAAAPYPPTPPCALSWSQTSSDEPMLVGSGYDVGQPVTVTLYPQARSLGYYATNSSGAFAVPVNVSPTNATSWVTASSARRSCSVAPPPRTDPTRTPTRTPTTSPAGGTPSSPRGTTGQAGGGSTTTATGSGTTGGSGTGGGTGGSGTGGGTDSSAYPPNRTPTAPSSGSTTAPSAPTSSTPGQPSRTSPSRPNDALRTPTALGLPLTVIVIIAALLLLAGGLGVLFLTRRSG